MEKLKRIVVVRGDENVGKSTILNLYLILKNHRTVYYKLKELCLCGGLTFSSKEDENKFRNGFHKDKCVSFDKTYRKNDKFSRIAVSTAGDTQEMVKYAFEFAEATEAEILVCACRNEESVRRFFEHRCTIYGIDPHILDVTPSIISALKSKDVWRLAECVEKMVRNESKSKVIVFRTHNRRTK